MLREGGGAAEEEADAVEEVEVTAGVFARGGGAPIFDARRDGAQLLPLAARRVVQAIMYFRPCQLLFGCA